MGHRLPSETCHWLLTGSLLVSFGSLSWEGEGRADKEWSFIHSLAH